MTMKNLLPLVALGALAGCAQAAGGDLGEGQPVPVTAGSSAAGSTAAATANTPAHPAAPPVAMPPQGGMPPGGPIGQQAQGGPPPMPAPVTASARINATGGEKLYLEYCGMCHTANGMGFGLLGRRLDEPDLEKRTDLVDAYITLAVRRGIGNMPPVPRGEVSDAQLAEITEYLLRNNPDAGGAK
ncbi:c-type cytochrome [Altericroceibacterium xinjiangense]|uniref:c-type cytochrome n=1 Tax=Altericroceibacterium xinjiangense TaxID=762261 RepID=UPI001F49A194|nr:cytochrome c [Altericroceibacterium xinjiangense]